MVLKVRAKNGFVNLDKELRMNNIIYIVLSMLKCVVSLLIHFKTYVSKFCFRNGRFIFTIVTVWFIMGAAAAYVWYPPQTVEDKEYSRIDKAVDEVRNLEINVFQPLPDCKPETLAKYNKAVNLINFISSHAHYVRDNKKYIEFVDKTAGFGFNGANHCYNSHPVY